MTTASRRALLAGAILAPAALWGCGAATGADEARTVVTRFQAALAAGNGAAACALLSDPARRAVAQQEGEPCPRAIGRMDLPPAAVTGAEAAIVDARVRLAGGRSAFLGRTGAGWRIDAIGCRPEPGRARQRPFACEVSA